MAGLPPAVEVVEDCGGPPSNPWRGYQLCLRDLPSSATHVVVIQDDAIVCRNFAPAVELIVNAVPDDPICLFLGGLPRATGKAALRILRNKATATFVPLNFRDFMPVVAVIWPKPKAEHMLEWSKDAKLPGMPNPRSDDAVCGAWQRFNKQRVWCAMPSLVQHPDDVDSHVRREPGRGRDTGRVALNYIGDRDPLEIDWKL